MSSFSLTKFDKIGGCSRIYLDFVYLIDYSEHIYTYSVKNNYKLMDHCIIQSSIVILAAALIYKETAYGTG